MSNHQQSVAPETAKRVLVYVVFVAAAFAPVWLNLLILAFGWVLLMILIRREFRLGVLLTLAALSVSYLLHIGVLRSG